MILVFPCDKLHRINFTKRNGSYQIEKKGLVKKTGVIGSTEIFSKTDHMIIIIYIYDGG